MGRSCRLPLPFATRGRGPGSNATQACSSHVNSVAFSCSNVSSNICSPHFNTRSNNVPNPKHSSCLKCMYTNADSLRNKMSELKSVVLKENPHIIAVTEAKPKHFRDLCEEDFILEGYNFYHTNIDMALGRGILIYVHKSLNVNRVNFDQIIKFEEVVWIELHLKQSDKLLVGCFYRSDSAPAANNEKLFSLISHVSELDYSHILLMGDFNYPDIDWESWTTSKNEASEEYRFIECIRDAFLFQHVVNPTRFRFNSRPNVLDLLFTNEENMVSNVVHCSPLGLSDHSVLVFDLQCYADSVSVERKRFLYNKGDFDGMRKSLSSVVWEDEFAKMNNDINQQWHHLVNIIEQAEDEFIPSKAIGCKPTWGKGSDFPVDSDTLKLIKHKHRCWERYMRERTQEKRVLYNRARNKVKAATRRCQKEYERSIAADVKTNPKKFWQYAKLKTKVKSGIPPLSHDGSGDDSTLIESNEGKANALLNHFSNVFTKEPDGPVPPVLNHDVDSLLSKADVSEECIVTKLENLNVSKSPGPDGLHPRVLSELASVIAKPLSILFSNSLSSGTVPRDWKKANVSAVFKKGNRKLPSNYRPISLTCIACKVLESILRDEIYEHMRANSLLSTRQFGFVSGRSTMLQLLNVLDEWTSLLESGGSVDVVYLDFMKAFDTVPHRQLLAKAEGFGIANPVTPY